MTNTPPKIWDTTFLYHSENTRFINYHTDRAPLDYSRENEAFKVVTRDQAPSYLYFDLSDLSEKYKNSLPDMFRVRSGVIIISERFHDLLLDFDLGDTQLFEIPLFEHNQKDRRPGIYYILHIAELKDDLVPDASENLKKYPAIEKWKPILDTDVIALRSTAAAGADLWVDKRLKRRIFFNDRLKTAMQNSKIRIARHKLRPCRIVG